MRDFHKKDDNRLAVVRGSRKIKYEEFFREIDRVAAGLFALGVRHGDVVMIALPNIIQSVVAVYAVAKLGAIASMIHPKLSEEQFEKSVKKQSPKVVFLSEVNLKEYKNVCKGIKTVFCSMLRYSYTGLPRATEYDAYATDGDDAMFIMHSGGTSGEPKDVVISHKAANAMAGNLLMSLGDKFYGDNAMLVVLPMFHGFGLCVGVHAAACTNMALILEPVFKPKKIVESIAKNHVTTIVAVPRMVQLLLQEKGFSGKAISTLKDVFVGGDSVGPELVKEFDERMKEAGAKATLSPGYGLTETVSVCALTLDGYREGSLGFAIKDVDTRIVDDDLNMVKVGEAGELLLSTPQMMLGYLNDEEATNKTLVIMDGKKWLRTGDLFRVDEEGHLYFLGRKKRLIKVSGMNVFPNEIERVAQELGLIKDCVVIESRKDGKSYIKLLVEEDLTLDEQSKIKAHIGKRLSHWSIPRDIERVEKFPRTQVGKVDVNALQKEEEAHWS